MANITHETDVLVIGSGFAGNRAALGAAGAGARVLQATLGAGGSPNIMGFSAPVTEGDSVEIIFSDLMKSGLGMNSPVLSRSYAEGTAELVADFEALGVPFRKDAHGKIQPLHSLGTTYPRLVIQYQCLTGNYIQKALNDRIHHTDNITLRTNAMITDLLAEEGRVLGACGIDVASGEFLVIKSRVVVVAAGGSGRIHSFTTYPNDVAGDSMAMAYRAGLRVTDMELLQFEPCCFVAPTAIKGFVNPTTFLKMGARLSNNRGEFFVDDYSTIQKDELSRKIYAEVMEGRGSPNGGVYYDVRMLPEEAVKITHYVHYEPALRAGGVDICKEISEVAPAGHSFQGGVVVNPDCSTEIAGLFIAGEAMGGVHGANRMGGDAGGAALVFGKIAGQSVAKAYRRFDAPADARVASLAGEIKEIIGNASRREGENPAVFRARIQQMMQEKVGLIKTEDTLTSALNELNSLETAFTHLSAGSVAALRDLLSSRNMLSTARMMAMGALERRESRGVHYRGDYPQRDDVNWSGRNVVISRGGDGKMRSSVVMREKE
ncbi:MAG: FAD-binding protein [Desulfovibrio sp.]|jgi:succinate dehydrogenase/fumarate reductase flavoprotein subunit|nr:FAD-binding protein [Desulfovibrio sp.]